MGYCLGAIECQSSVRLCPVSLSKSDLIFSSLAQSWDEAIPLGNATIGALIWKKDSTLHFSLDRTDLWDLRPTDSLSGDNYRFSWVKEQIQKKDYLPVQKKFDWPYDNMPTPSKILGAALEFSLSELEEPSNVHLYLNNALCEVTWQNGIRMQTFVHATKPLGWFIFTNLKTTLEPRLIAPMYTKFGKSKEVSPVSGQDLRRLGYEQGTVIRKSNQLVFHQKGHGDFSYDVVVNWKQENTPL